MFEPGTVGFWLLLSIGPVIGLAGGVFGTWNSLRKCTTQAQRRVMWKWTILMWAGIAIFLTAMLLLPKPWNWLVWVPYAPALIYSITRLNREMAAVGYAGGCGWGGCDSGGRGGAKH